MSTDQQVSGSKFKTRPSYSSPSIKSAAKFHKVYRTQSVRAIIEGAADVDNTSQPKPSSTIK